MGGYRCVAYLEVKQALRADSFCRICIIRSWNRRRSPSFVFAPGIRGAATGVTRGLKRVSEWISCVRLVRWCFAPASSSGTVLDRSISHSLACILYPKIRTKRPLPTTTHSNNPPPLTPLSPPNPPLSSSPQPPTPIPPTQAKSSPCASIPSFTLNKIVVFHLSSLES